MTARMPDFAMPSDEELAAERRAAEAAAAAAMVREDAPAGPSVDPPPFDAGSLATEPARGEARPRRSLGARASSLARAPMVAFATGGVLVAALVLVPAAVAESAAQRSSAAAHEVLDAYVEAVRSGDVEAATAAWMPTGTQASIELLEAGAAPDELPEVECAEPIVGDRRATASCEVSVTSAGYASNGRSTIVLEREDGTWRVTAGIAEIASLVAPGTAVRTVGGASAAGVGDLQWLLPGGYDLEWSASRLFEGEDLGNLVVMQGGGWLQVDAQLSPEARADAEATALAFVDACLVDAVTAQSCSLELPSDREPLAASAETGYGWSEHGYLASVRIAGLDDADAPIVEVEVLLAPDGASWQMVVRSVQRWGEP